MIDMPYSNTPDAIAPRTKYFIADSAATGDSRSNATIADNASDRSSRPRYMVSKLNAEIMTMMPSKANKPSRKYSPL